MVTPRAPQNSPHELNQLSSEKSYKNMESLKISEKNKSNTVDAATQTEGHQTPPGTYVQDLFSPRAKHQQSTVETGKKPWADGIRGSYGSIAGKNYMY